MHWTPVGQRLSSSIWSGLKEILPRRASPPSFTVAEPSRSRVDDAPASAAGAQPEEIRAANKTSAGFMLLLLFAPTASWHRRTRRLNPDPIRFAGRHSK